MSSSRCSAMLRGYNVLRPRAIGGILANAPDKMGTVPMEVRPNGQWSEGTEKKDSQTEKA